MEPQVRQRMECILDEIGRIVFPARTVSVMDYGAQPDTEKCQTTAVQAAIDDLSRQGGGHVLIPEGVFLTGALELKSFVDLHLQGPGSVLRFTSEITPENYPLVECRWEGSACWNYSPLIYARNAQNIAVTGPGILDGQAGAGVWWNWHHQVEDAWSKDLPNLQEPARRRLRAMDEAGAPCAERVFGEGSFLRPNFIQPIGCTNVLLQDFTLLRSPMWQLNPVQCKNVVIRDLTLTSYGPNNDGCDPESCENVLIEGCLFQTGDDCISLKSGRVRTGDPALACRKVIIRNNTFQDGHGGITIGSEMSNDVSHVYALHNHFSSPELAYALRFKSNARRGGSIHDIWLCDTEVSAVREAAVHATMLYEDGANGAYLPSFYGIHIDGLYVRGGQYGIFLDALLGSPVRELSLKNIEIEQVKKPLCLRCVERPSFEQVRINGTDYPTVTAVFLPQIPAAGDIARAEVVYDGGVQEELRYEWSLAGPASPGLWQRAGTGDEILLPEDTEGCLVRVTVWDRIGRTCASRPYRVLAKGAADTPQNRLAVLDIASPCTAGDARQPVSCRALGGMLYPICFGGLPDAGTDPLQTLVHCGMLPPDAAEAPDRAITRQELATVAMQSCGLSYQNASTTMPVCADVSCIAPSFGTNIARALYFGFLSCDAQGNFRPLLPASCQDVAEMLASLAKFRQM